MRGHTLSLSTTSRPTYKSIAPSSPERSVRRATHASCAVDNQLDGCQKCFVASTRARLLGTAATAVLFVACGSAVPSATFATTLAEDQITPVAQRSLDRKPMLRFRHQCMPLLPASLDEQTSAADQSEWPASDTGKQTQTARRLPEKYRVPPPACNSTGGRDFVVSPKRLRVSQPLPRFASEEAPPGVSLPVAALPSPVMYLADEMPADFVLPGKYVPGPVDVGWKIYVGSAVAAFPFVLGSYEFGKRIIIQRRCDTCSGIGLVKNSRGTALLKCSDCGGFFPWLGWKTFFTSTASPGNGGPLRAPKGQTSVFYNVPPKPSKTPDSATETQPLSAPDASSHASVEEPTGVGKS